MAFDNTRTDGCKAKRIMDAPTLEQMSKTLMPATYMRANVEAQTCVDDAPAQEVETNDATDLATWWNGVVKSEGCDTWVAELVNA